MANRSGWNWPDGGRRAGAWKQACYSFLTTPNTSFRKRYVLTQFNAATPSTAVIPATTTFPGCKIDPTTGVTSCSCPTVVPNTTTPASLRSNVLPSFTVAFQAVPGDNDAVKFTAHACTAQAGACTSTTYANAEGNSRVGQPAQNAMVASDSSLSALSSSDPTCNNSQMFNAYFGSTIAKYRASPSTKILSCSSASDCKSKLQGAYDDGWRAFYFDSDLQLSGNNTYGTQTDPITIVTSQPIKINGNNEFYGLIFPNSADSASTWPAPHGRVPFGWRVQA